MSQVTYTVTQAILIVSAGAVRPRKWSRPVNDPSTANDPQLGPQMIPRPEMIPANGVSKNREWRGLHEEIQLWKMVKILRDGINSSFR